MEINKSVTGKREHAGEEKGEGKERVMLLRLRPSRMRADVGKEPDTRRDTRTRRSSAKLSS